MNGVADSVLPILTAYCLLIILASLLGGWIPQWIRPTHTRLQLGTSLVAGMMLGVGFLHLLPHAYAQLGSLDLTVALLVAGFLVVFFLQRFFHFHHHDVPGEHTEECHHVHHQDCVPVDAPGHEHCCEEHSLARQSAQRLSWTGVTLGIMLHSLFDGVAVAAAVGAESHGGDRILVGFGTFLVVLLHKPFDALAVGTLMARDGHSSRNRNLANGLLALAIPLGVLFFQLGLSSSSATSQVLGGALAFSAGTFVCIASSDLLPELQFHAHDRFKLSMALLLGLGIAVGIGHLEGAGHDGYRGHIGHVEPPGH